MGDGVAVDPDGIVKLTSSADPTSEILGSRPVVDPACWHQVRAVNLNLAELKKRCGFTVDTVVRAARAQIARVAASAEVKR